LCTNAQGMPAFVNGVLPRLCCFSRPGTSSVEPTYRFWSFSLHRT